jgi:hypothetical protein
VDYQQQRSLSAKLDAILENQHALALMIASRPGDGFDNDLQRNHLQQAKKIEMRVLRVKG